MAPRLTTMDRIFLAIILGALLMIGAASLYVTRTADLMPQARTIGADHALNLEAGLELMPSERAVAEVAGGSVHLIAVPLFSPVTIPAEDLRPLEILRSGRGAVRALGTAGDELPARASTNSFLPMTALHSVFQTSPFANCPNVDSTVTFLAVVGRRNPSSRTG